ncbi:lysyl oxidase-like 4 [Desmophyllum pertusum]|uniref:Lysyl oxidase-like 4 n=1 Tax=Desmophyllum pertusum TaxID=174260 RepID=A0A9X0A1L4_9CNID|nr:lysyl oxidase-like 4 [Desmophyllum pertusum]
MLGFPDMLRYTKGAKEFGPGNNGFWLDDVKCGGDERSITLCSHREWGRHNCRNFNQAGVVCKLHLNDKITTPKPAKNSGEVLTIKVRLQGPVVNDYISEGVVQVEHQGKWGYICPSNWISVNSYVLCGQLGFPNTRSSRLIQRPSRMWSPSIGWTM